MHAHSSQAGILSDAQENAVAKKNAVLYATCLAINGSAAPLCIALGGIVGSYLLGTDKSLATAPVTGFSVGVALASLPAAMLMRKVGRRHGFMAGVIIGMSGMLVAVEALRIQSFWLFVAAMLLTGSANSFAQQYRFAAADRGTRQFKAKAISMVLVGGIAAAIIGPQMILHFKDFLAPVPFAGAYLWAIGLFASSLIVMQFLESGVPVKTAEEVAKGKGRPLGEIVMQPRFIVAVFCGTASYAIMAYLMTAAPLAMIACGFDIDDATWGIQWHVMAMFGPSFFTGHLIARFGKEKIVAVGLMILVACALIALSGITLMNFYATLVLLGIGWNFGFIGATSMITDTYEPHEKSKAQGANDFILFGTVAFASLMSGLSLNNMGWSFINWVVFPIAGLALLSLIWLSTRPKAGVFPK